MNGVLDDRHANCAVASIQKLLPGRVKVQLPSQGLVIHVALGGAHVSEMFQPLSYLNIHQHHHPMTLSYRSISIPNDSARLQLEPACILC